MDRDRAMFLAEQHQPAVLWRLLRLRRCTTCRRRWPCPRYLDARSALVGHDRLSLAALLQRNSRWAAS